MPEKIRLAFTDFWGGFEPDNNLFINLLRSHFNVELSERPDYLIFSNSGIEHTRYNCTKIYYTGENLRPDLRESDYAISFDYDDYQGRNIRFPLYNLYGDIADLTRPKDIEKILVDKTRFCNMVVSNPNCSERNEFFRLLSRYRQIDSGGSCFNNVGGRVADKRSFISTYKFTLAFENSSCPGYTTEKIFEPMLMGSIPIYWGNPRIETDFNPDSFVNLHRFANFAEAVEYIVHLDNDDAAYVGMLQQPWLPENRPTKYSSTTELVDFFARVFSHRHSFLKGSMKNLYGKTCGLITAAKRRYGPVT